MILYILRHGEAEPKSGVKRDEERKLTQIGVQQVQKTVGLAKVMRARVDSIVSSPLARAKQTSKIVAGMLEVNQTRISNALEPESSPSEIYSELSSFRPQDNLALVTHQPLVSKLLSEWLGADLNIDMQPGSLARIDFSEYPKARTGNLIYLLSGSLTS